MVPSAKSLIHLEVPETLNLLYIAHYDVTDTHTLF